MALSRAVDSADAVVLFADLQPALVRNSRTNPPAMITAIAAALADAGELLGWPFLFSVVPEDGGPATPLPELAALATQNRLFTRRCASPFGDAGFVAALEATGRRTLVLAAYSAEAVVQFAGLDAIERGYRVVVALDSCGARSERTEAAALRRIERAGDRHLYCRHPDDVRTRFHRVAREGRLRDRASPDGHADRRLTATCQRLRHCGRHTAAPDRARRSNDRERGAKIPRSAASAAGQVVAKAAITSPFDK